MIILLNGPPGCGKDTIAKIIKKKIGSRDYKLSKPLKDAFSGLFAVHGQLLHELLEERKDAKFWVDSKMTPREILIALSEEFIKPRFGDDFFGHIAAVALHQLAGKHKTISDCGFNAEVPPIADAFGYNEVKAILINRPDCEWDSRESLNYKNIGIQGTNLNNLYDLDMLDTQVTRILRRWGLIDDGS